MTYLTYNSLHISWKLSYFMVKKENKEISITPTVSHTELSRRSRPSSLTFFSSKQPPSSLSWHGHWRPVNFFQAGFSFHSLDYTYVALIQDGSKLGLHLFVWKIRQYLINNNTKTNSAPQTTVDLLLPHPVHSMVKRNVISGQLLAWPHLFSNLYK